MESPRSREPRAHDVEAREPTVEPETTSEPVAEAAAPSEPAASDATPPGACLEPVVTVEPTSRGGHLRAALRNATATPLTIEVPDRCPSGAGLFRGIDIDVYSTCNAGMCQPNRPPRRVVVPAGGEVEVARATVDGRPPCQTGLRAGSYAITFSLPGSTGTPLCPAVPATLVVP